MHNGRREPRRMRYSLESRLRIVRLIEGGETPERAAAALGASRASGYRMWRRYQQEGWQGLADRRSTPKRQPRRLSAEEEARIVALRHELCAGPQVLAVILGRPPSTVGKVLRRAGCSRLPQPERIVRSRYERDRPGELLHVDVKKLGRFWEVGKRIRNDGIKRSRRAGWSYLGRRDRRSHAPGVRRAAQRRARPQLRRVSETRDGLVCRARDHARARALRQRQGLPRPLLANGLQRARHPAPLHPALQPMDEWQSRSADQDDAARMGLPPRISHQQPPSTSAQRLPALVQPPPATRLTGSPTTDQPRLERV